MKKSGRISGENRVRGLLAIAAESKTPFRHAELCQKLAAWTLYRIMSQIQGAPAVG
jgi:hypothetical protein